MIKTIKDKLLEHKIKKRVKAENSRPILLDEVGMFPILSRLKLKALIEDKRN